MSAKYEASINYLVNLKFPENRLLTITKGKAGEKVSAPTSAAQASDQRANYEQQLRQKSLKEIEALYQTESAALNMTLGTLPALKATGRFFDLPNAYADTNYWAKLAYWRLEEAVALSFAREPKVVNWDSLKGVSITSGFKKSYADLREMATRAKLVKQLYDPVTPGVYLAWAQRMSVDLPDELLAAVDEMGVTIADWQSICEKQKETIESLNERNGILVESVKDKDSIIDKLVERVKSNESTVQSAPEPRGQLNANVDLGATWNDLQKSIKRAIELFPAWRDSVNKVQKSGNLQDWLTAEFKFSNREAEVVKKVLSDSFEELQ